MCLAIPGKIISVDKSIPDLKMARVDFGGVVKNICIEWTDAEAGEYILAHAGVALGKIDENEARRSISELNKIMDGIESSTTNH
ncbi:MAG: HypC/HybG/HupF family hydrogenase formation chaperone [Bacteroidales bacterium]